MGIFVTGDTHGDISRLLYRELIKGHIATNKDVIFILGDFGVIFDNTPSFVEELSLDLMAKRENIFMVVDGNHENHPRLNNLPDTDIFGGKAKIIKGDNIFLCKRGEIYCIEDKKIFTFGGATSIDRKNRIEHVTWWKEEVATYTEMDYGLENLKIHKNSVDYILAHTAPENISQILIKKLKSFFNDKDQTREYLEHVCSTVSFKEFYCGHWHVEEDIDNYHFLFKSILKIT